MNWLSDKPKKRLVSHDTLAVLLLCGGQMLLQMILQSYTTLERAIYLAGGYLMEWQMSNLIRLWISPFIHASFGHILANLFFGTVLLLLMNRNPNKKRFIYQSYLVSCISIGIVTIVLQVTRNEAYLNAIEHTKLLVGFSSPLYALLGILSSYYIIQTLYALMTKQKHVHLLFVIGVILYVIGYMSSYTHATFTVQIPHNVPLYGGILYGCIQALYDKKQGTLTQPKKKDATN